MSYVIVAAKTSEELSPLIDERFNDWYDFVWWVTYTNDYFYQWMYKKERKHVTKESSDPKLKEFMTKRNSINKLSQSWKEVHWLKPTVMITPKLKQSWKKLLIELDKFEFKEWKDKYILLYEIMESYVDHIESLKPSPTWYHDHRFSFDEFITKPKWALKFINNVDIKSIIIN